MLEEDRESVTSPEAPTPDRHIDQAHRSVVALTADLRKLGVQDGEALMVHASLRRLGPVEGGARGVVAAMDRAVGVGGTLLMVLGARDDHAWVNDRPVAERAALLTDAESFDHLLTPADPSVGVLAEAFRREPGTVVNDHPEGRFAARGRLAKELLADAPWHDYYGPGSPLERLVAAGGWVLRLGADPGTVTLLHHAEYLADLPEKRRVRRLRKVRAAGGAELVWIECLDDEHGIVPYPGADYFADLLLDYLAAGHGRRGTVGGARAELLPAADLIAYAVPWMEERLSA